MKKTINSPKSKNNTNNSKGNPGSAPLSQYYRAFQKVWHQSKNSHKWRKRKSLEDESHAAKKYWNQKLIPSDIQIILETRKQTGLSLDDLLQVVNH